MAPEATKRYAVVTGANKGIGFEIVRQLGSSNGITVVLGCRDEKRGLEAVEKLKGLGVSDVIFHQLDVTDSASIASFADFVKAQFGKLDILVNNAGIIGVQVDDPDVARHSFQASEEERAKLNYNEIWVPTYETASSCFQINYYGTKKTTEALLPLLQFSDSPRIVNVSSMMGKLQGIPNEWAKGILSDAESLTEEKIDQVLNEYLKDFKEGKTEAKGWPTFMGAYIVSKAAVNGLTRILAKKYPTFLINSVCPGFVKTDLNCNSGQLTTAEGAESPVRLALLPDDGPTGTFFIRKEVSSFE